MSAPPRKKKQTAPEPPAAAPEPPGREVRPYIYGGLDILFAAVYAYLITNAMPSAHGWVNGLAWGLIALMAISGGAMIARWRPGWWLSATVCVLFLLTTVAVFFVLLHTAGFLNGVYGAFGEGAAMGSLLGAALVIELLAILPALQLKYLMTRAGRRSFGMEPLW